MKKNKTFLVIPALLLTFSFSIFTMSCARFLDYSGGNVDSNIPTDLKDDFLYQEGCKTTNKSNIKNENSDFAGFLGESLFHYSSYLENGENKTFFGNKQNVLNCDGNTFVKSVWKGQRLNLQFVLINKANIDNIKNLKIELSGDDFISSNNEEIINDKKNVGWAKFNKFIKTPKPANSNSKHLYNKTLYIPDAVGITEMEKVKYDVQPIYISINVGENVKEGLKNMKLDVSYELNDENKKFSRDFKFEVLNRKLMMDDPNENDVDKFGFTAQTFPADSLRYWYEDPSEYYQTPIDVGPDETHRAAYLRDEKAKNYLRQYLKPLKESNASFAFATGYHKQVIQWTANFKNNLTLNEIEKEISNNSFESIMKKYENDVDFNFTFNSLIDYLDIIAESGIPALDISLFEKGNFSSWAVPNGEQVGPQVEWTAKIINGSSGKTESDFNLYKNKIIEPMLKQLSDVLQEGYKNGRFILENGKKLRVLVNTDELNEQAMDEVEKIVNDVNKYSVNKYGGDFKPIGINSFVGWRSKIDLTNDNYLKNNFINSYDQYVFHSREVNKAVNNTTWKRLEDSILERRSNNKTTMSYSTFGDYPGSYMASDISESLWNVIFNRKLSLNGFLRWAYDKAYSNYFESEQFDSIETGQEIREPGQAFLIYGGDDENGVHYSVRMLAMIEAVQNVYKYNALLKEGKNLKTLNQSMSNIGITDYAHNNNEYKWNLSKDWKFLYMNPNEGYKKPVAMQVYEFIKTLEKY